MRSVSIDQKEGERCHGKGTYLSVARDDRVTNAVQNVDTLRVSTDVDGLGTRGQRHRGVNLLYRQSGKREQAMSQKLGDLRGCRDPTKAWFAGATGKMDEEQEIAYSMRRT